MNDGSPHELSAAYALDALDADDLRTFEAHLATCERCREDVASFREAAAALGHDVDTPPPPETLERRILSAARAERPNVVRLRQRWALPAAGVAAVAAAVAIGLGIWVTHLSHSLDRERSAHARDARVVSILAQPGVTQIPTEGNSGLLIISPSRNAVLVADELAKAPSGKTYEAWIIRGNTARAAGLFEGGGSPVVPLTHPVPRGSVVGVTIEKAGGAKLPTTSMVLRATVT
jgi:anti-sigma-K factor RskA